MRVTLSAFSSPIGAIQLAETGGALVALAFSESEAAFAEGTFDWLGAADIEHASRTPLHQQIRDYFDGNLPALESVVTKAAGTDFQQRVWDELRSLPPGTTASYSDIAKRLGNPGAVRAVGAANGRNPVPLVVPCHRVIASNGALSGYSGGQWRKAWLLEHERRHRDEAGA